MALVGPSGGLFLLAGHASLTHGDGNGLFLRATFLDHLGDVFGDRLLRFTLG